MEGSGRLGRVSRPRNKLSPAWPPRLHDWKAVCPTRSCRQFGPAGGLDASVGDLRLDPDGRAGRVGHSPTIALPLASGLPFARGAASTLGGESCQKPQSLSVWRDCFSPPLPGPRRPRPLCRCRKPRLRALAATSLRRHGDDAGEIAGADGIVAVAGAIGGAAFGAAVRGARGEDGRRH
jgi:hypothetical protein